MDIGHGTDTILTCDFALAGGLVDIFWSISPCLILNDLARFCVVLV